MAKASKSGKARAIGFNHVVLEVDDLDAALEFYGKFLELPLRSRGETMAFVDMGDQFLVFATERTQGPDRHRHIGLVVDDREPVRRALEEMGVELRPGRGVDFLDPWGNRIQLVEYADIQFSKTPGVLRGMGLEDLTKTAAALAELAEKGMTPD